MSSINEELQSIFIHIPKVAGGSMANAPWNRGNGHDTVADFASRLGDKLQDYFIWAFVRNPFERIVSAYEDCPEVFPHAPTFRDFIKQIHYNRHELRGLRCVRFTNCARFRFPLGRIHWLPMHLLICDRWGNSHLDFVGRYENIEADWVLIQEHFGIYPQPLPRHNQRKNKAGRRNSYWLDLYDAELVEMVAEIYKQDLDLFGYEAPTL